MLTIAICDDSAEDSTYLRTSLLKHLAALYYEAEIALFSSGEALLEAVEANGRNFSLFFLDIYMDGLTGMETARRLRGLREKAPIVFLTSSPDFAVEGYEVTAAGYLIKPLDQAKFSKLLSRVLAPARHPRMALKCGGVCQYYDYDDLCYIESRSHILYFHLSHGGPIQLRGQLDELEQQLQDKRFLRCHQSFLVNMDYVYKVNDGFHLHNGSFVPIRVRSRKMMTDAYYRYFIEHTVSNPTEEVGGYV